MSRAVLSLGSNLGDRLAYLRTVVDGMRGLLVSVSSVYETAAWGVSDQPDFLNAVCIVADPTRDHWDWLRTAQEFEARAGRVRTQRWGPRVLDVDVITVDDVRSDAPELLLPHPGAAERATVLIPWLEADPEAEVPGRGRVDDLVTRLPDAECSSVVVQPALQL